MEHVDPGVKGKMVQEILRLIMVVNYQEETGYLDFEVNFHKGSYGVEEHMYPRLLKSVHTVIKKVTAAQWTDKFENAWLERTEKLGQELASRHKVKA